MVGKNPDYIVIESMQPNEKPRPYMEYQSLLQLVNKEDAREDAYHKLISKENVVLETMNRVIEHEQKKQQQSTLSSRLVELVHDFARVWIIIIYEATNTDWGKPKLWNKINKVFLEGERKIYIGITLVLCCVFLFFVNINS